MAPVRLSLFLVAALTCTGLPAADNTTAPLELGLTATGALPVGSDAQRFAPSYGGGITWGVPLGFWTTALEGGYTFQDRVDGFPSLSIVNLGLLGRVTWPVVPGLGLDTQVSAGGFYVRVNDDSGLWGANPYIGTGLGAAWTFAPGWAAALVVRGQTRIYLDTEVGASLEIRVRPGSGGETAPAAVVVPEGFRPLSDLRKDLKAAAYRSAEVYPVLWKSYETRAPFQLLLHNYNRSPIKNISLKVEAKGLTTIPQVVKVPASLGPGLQIIVDVPVFATEKLFSLVPGSLSVNLNLSYEKDGKTVHETYAPAASILAAARFPADIPESQAAFVAPRDPTVSLWANLTAAQLWNGANPALPAELLTATALFEALNLGGPGAAAVPRRSFPRETLGSQQAAEADLALLWTALLEASGLEAALVFSGDQILPAFALSAATAKVQDVWGTADRFLNADGRSWVPLAPGARSPGLAGAWNAAADTLLQARGAPRVVPLRQAWKTYPPALPAGRGPEVPADLGPKLAKALGPAVTALVEAKAAPVLDPLRTELKTAPASQRDRLENRLGLQLVRFGLYTQAVPSFKKLSVKGQLASLVNLGNALLLSGEAKAAVDPLEAALKVQPADPAALAALALTYRSLGDTAMRKAATDQLAKVDKDRAARIAALKAVPAAAPNRFADLTVLSSLVVWKE